jgi:hypothetical protein
MKLVLEKTNRARRASGSPLDDGQHLHPATDPAGNIKADKEKSTEKIDGAIATIMALRPGDTNGQRQCRFCLRFERHLVYLVRMLSWFDVPVVMTIVLFLYCTKSDSVCGISLA